ncbi:MAG: dihydrodipicolinate reductase C-terminal domain-containing protein [Bryobacteraceae bacterium]
MKIAIVGYGKMGRLIDQLASGYDCEVALKLDDSEGITRENLAGIDVAIEFSTPHTAVDTLERLAAAGVNTVVGTTGWHDRLDQVARIVNSAGTGLIWSPNFSIGVNAFFHLVSEASRLLSGYGAWAWEIHHDAKKDAPSGTLVKLVELMKHHQVDVSSNRAGMHPGTHEIGFDSAADTITLRHTARNREGFARGALAAARWIEGKKGVFKFGEDM